MKHKKSMFIAILIILGGCLGALGTFQLQKAGLSPLVASCFIGLIGALIGYFINNEDLAMVIFAGSFVGMTTIAIATTPIIIVAGILCGLLYWGSTHLFDGYGGKLGALAFISIGIVMVLFSAFGRE